MFTATAFFGQETAQQNLLLDLYSGASAAYGLRKLRSSYSGSAIRIRRSNDNTEQDIGFTSTGALDTSAISSFVGANSAFVKTWYDQSGNTRNITQATNGNQPRIVNAGTIDTIGGETAVYFGTSANDWYLTFPTGYLNGTSTLSWFHVLYVTDFASSNAGIFGPRNNSTGLEILQVDLITRPTFLRINNVVRNDNAAAGYRLWNNNTQTIMTIIGNATSTAAWRNNTAVTFTNSAAFPSLNYNGEYLLGRYNTDVDPKPMNGYQQELIIYTTDQTSNRTAIQGNMNAYYSAY